MNGTSLSEFNHEDAAMLLKEAPVGKVTLVLSTDLYKWKDYKKNYSVKPVEPKKVPEWMYKGATLQVLDEVDGRFYKALAMELTNTHVRVSYPELRGEWSELKELGKNK